MTPYRPRLPAWIRKTLFGSLLATCGFLMQTGANYVFSIDQQTRANAAEIDKNKAVEGAHYSELGRTLGRIEHTVDRIDDRLDKKADKP